MADPTCDCCNPLSVWESFIAMLSAAFATASLPSRTEVPLSIRPPFLGEPNFEIREHPGGFQVGKPNYGIFDTTVAPSAPLTVIRNFATRPDAEKFVRSTPKIRLPTKLQIKVLPNGSLISLPASPDLDWTSDPDAQNVHARLKNFFNQIPLGATLPGPPIVTTALAILPAGVTAQTRPHRTNPGGSEVFIDPFQISQGTLELCATYAHELTHVQFLQRRGFPSVELASLLSLDEYLLVTLDEELGCFKNEVTAVQQFLAVVPGGSRQAFTKSVDTAISAPAKLFFASGLAAMPPATVEKLTHKGIGDEYRLRNEAEYRRASGSVAPSAAAGAWISSPEWTAIQATLPAWQDAGVL